MQSASRIQPRLVGIYRGVLRLGLDALRTLCSTPMQPCVPSHNPHGIRVAAGCRWYRVLMYNVQMCQ